MRVLAGTPPGGGQDRAARALELVLDGRVDVVNIPGRGGGNAWDELMAFSGSEDICAVSSPTLITNKVLGVSSIDDRDLSPIAILYTEYTVALTRPGSELTDPQSLWSALAEGRVDVAFATAIGSINHLVLAAVCKQVGIRPEVVPLRVHDSARDAITDLVEGSADVALVSMASAAPELKRAEISAVFVSAPTPMQAPSSRIPTLAQLGIDCVLGMWRGLVGPPGLEESALSSWDRRLSAATASTEWQDLLMRNSWTGTYMGCIQTRAFLDQQRQELEALLVSAGVGDG